MRIINIFNFVGVAFASIMLATAAARAEGIQAQQQEWQAGNREVAFETLGLARNDEARCDRSLTIDSLSQDERVRLNRGERVTRFVRQSNGYEIGYIFSLAGFDAELTMGVYSSCGEHAGNDGLGGFIVKSRILGRGDSSPFRVFYEQHVSWPYSNGEYTVENIVKAENGGYILDSKLLNSSDAGFSPRYADAYVRVVPNGRGIFVTACNYMIPRTGSWQETFNDLGRERLNESGERLLGWVGRVSQDNARAAQYRERLRRLLSR